MGLDGFFPTRAARTRKHVNTLVSTASRLEKDQTDLSVAFNRLSDTSTAIDATIVQLQKRDLGEHKKLIDEMQIDSDYKDNLKKELDSSKQAALDTLNPLREKTEKLRAHMVVSQEKALQYLAVVNAQIEVLKAGSVQIKVLKELQEQGNTVGSRIEELLDECERINRITQDTIRSFEQNSGQATKGFLGNSSIIGSRTSGTL